MQGLRRSRFTNPTLKSPSKYGKGPTAMRNARKAQSWLQEVRENKLHATYEKL